MACESFSLRHSDRMNAEQEEEFVDLMDAVGRTHMPFGKFGPGQFPPVGVPLYDLPYEYLAWFARKGFPKGRLGELMRFIYLAKQDGAGAMFDVFRVAGRTQLRKTRQKDWNFDGAEDGS